MKGSCPDGGAGSAMCSVLIFLVLIVLAAIS
jgi:hypothetical protein